MPSLLFPDDLGRVPLVERFQNELQKLAHGIDVAVAAREDAEAMAACFLGSQTGRRRFQIEVVDPPLFEMAADMLREAASGSRNSVIRPEVRSDRDVREIGNMPIGDRRSPKGAGREVRLR
jgi:hypothetical protein